MHRSYLNNRAHFFSRAQNSFIWRIHVIFFSYWIMRLVVWSSRTCLLLLQWFPPLYGHFFLVFHFLQLFPAKDQVRLRETFSFTHSAHFFPCLVTDLTWLVQPWHISVEMQSAFAYRMLPSFCFASYNSMLHSVLKLILNSRDMKKRFF